MVSERNDLSEVAYFPQDRGQGDHVVFTVVMPFLFCEAGEKVCLFILWVGDSHLPCVDEEPEDFIAVPEMALKFVRADRFVHELRGADEDRGGEHAVGCCRPNKIFQFDEDCVVNEN